MSELPGGIMHTEADTVLRGREFEPVRVIVHDHRERVSKLPGRSINIIVMMSAEHEVDAGVIQDGHEIVSYPFLGVPGILVSQM